MSTTHAQVSGEPTSGVAERERRFEACFDLHYARVLAYGLRRLPDCAAAEDAAAEAFLIAWRRFDNAPADLLPWLLAIARNVIRNESRSARRRDRLAMSVASDRAASGVQQSIGWPDQRGDDSAADVAAVRAALERLSDRDREILLLTSWDGLDASRAAGALGCSSGTFAVRLHRARIARMIAADTDSLGSRSSARRRAGAPLRIKVTAAPVAAAAAVAVTAVALDSGTPVVQTASAKTISGVLRALIAPTGSILHIDATTIQTTVGHPTYTWEQDVYEQTSPPYRARIVDKRLPGTPAGTEAVYGVGIGEQTYDPTNNTIYDPKLPKPRPGERTPTPAQEAQLFEPYMAQYVWRLRAKLTCGAARADGRATVDGRAAIKITFARSEEIDFVAADGSYAPIEAIQGSASSPDGQTINVFHAFAFLPAAGNSGLLNLMSQHPSAKIDRSLSDFRAAGKRLFPYG